MMKNKQTVLIVDDIADNLNVAANTLIKQQINVLLAQSGKEALKTAEKFLPDLVLLDIMMPEMNGFEVCSRLKMNERTRNIPVVFLTAVGEAKNIIKGFELGAVDYVTKPFHIEELLARVQAHLTISRMRKEKENANEILEQQVNMRTAQLRVTNEELQIEIIERKTVEKELKENNKKLEKAKIKAEESDRLKTAFLNNISHEIRTPMNGIIGFANLLKMPNTPYDEQKTYIDTILESTDQLLSIVSDIMIISTIHAGQEKVIPSHNEVSSVISGVISQFRMEAEAKNVKINLKNTENNALKLYTDGKKLKQILIKLISNAVKYTPEGNIECGYNMKNDYAEFYVKDTGIGISPEMHNEIFEQFRQVDLELARTYGGTGLGLSIAKAYVNLLGGRIWLKSELGKGAIFYFTIPLEIN